jgi:serine/threonine protein kinase
MLRDVAELRVPTPVRARLPQQGELLQQKYRIEERLGVGGMGVVFRATNVENGKQVAIKWLLSRSEKACARFAREGRTAAQIDHPNVVNVFDVGEHRGSAFLVMELLRGASLRRRLSSSPLSAHELVGVMLPVLRGVRAAHAAGVIHRDLKPDNVFLCVASDGTAREPKVLDFGISKLRGQPQQGERLTAEGSGLGTLAYMSPEQLADAASVDERTDIYALGVMLYEGLSGRLPFEADSSHALVLAIATLRPAPLRTLVKELDPALERIVTRAMAREARDRHPDAQSLIDELSSWLRAAPELARTEPETASVPPARALPRAPRWRGVALLVASLGLSLWMAARASSPSRQLAQARPTAPAQSLPAASLQASTASAPPASSSSEPVVSPRAASLAPPLAPVPSTEAGAALSPAPKRLSTPVVRARSRAGELKHSEL